MSMGVEARESSKILMVEHELLVALDAESSLTKLGYGVRHRRDRQTSHDDG